MDQDEALRALAATPAEGDEVDRIGAKLRANESGAEHLTVPWLLAAWAQSVTWEDPYAWSVDEYTHDLFGRDLLAKAEEMAPDEIRERLKASLKPLDEEFSRKTVTDHEKRLPMYFRIGEAWWWSRIPFGVDW